MVNFFLVVWYLIRDPSLQAIHIELILRASSQMAQNNTHEDSHHFKFGKKENNPSPSSKLYQAKYEVGKKFSWKFGKDNLRCLKIVYSLVHEI